MEVAQGYAVNNNRDIVNENTREWTSIAARITGLKPMQEVQEARVLVLDRQYQVSKRARMNKLRDNVMALARSDNLDGDALVEIAEQYIAKGGQPDDLKRWIKGIAIKATVSKFDQRVVEELRRNPRGQEVLKFLSIDNSDE
jgi:hypothetical protein